MKINEIIRDLRIQNGWSQDELAQKAGYSDRSMITRIEKGTVDLSHSKILLFASIFDVDPVFLMGLSNNQSDISKEEGRLLSMYRTLDDRDKIKAEGYIEGLASDDKYKKGADTQTA